MASSISIVRLAHIFSIGAAAWLSGNIAALSLIVVPALQQSRAQDGVTANTLVRQWHRIYNIGAVQNPSVALTGAIASAYLAWTSQTPANTSLFTVVALLTVGIAPFTVIAMSATNNKLIEYAHTATTGKKAGGVSADEEIERLVEKWKFLNMMRSILPLAAFVVGIMAML